jgi:hypothetical protein
MTGVPSNPLGVKYVNHLILIFPFHRTAQALKYFNIAHRLEPLNPNVKTDRDSCQYKLLKLKRQDHLDPMYFNDETLHKDLYDKNSEGHKAQQRGVLLGNPLSICGEGHNYRYGRGDYKVLF